MRTFKFRGKGIKSGQWFYGSVVPFGNSAYIFKMFRLLRMEHAEVDPATVGQFTGLTDADGKDIYEGDLLLSDENAEVFEVVYDAPRFCFKDNDFGFRFLNHPEFFHVIGNIHDNKKLLEKGDDQ